MIQRSANATAVTVTQERPSGEVPAAPPPSRDAASDLLDIVLGLTASGHSPRVDGRLEQFLLEPSPAQALKVWLGPNFAFSGPDVKDRICRRLGRDIARLDELLNRQVNAILHHDRFQRLEASWRGLSYLTEQVSEAENVKLLVLSVSFAELGR